MKYSRTAPRPSTDGWAGSSSPLGSPAANNLASAVRRSIVRSRHRLLSEQSPAGCWRWEIEGGSQLASDTILLLAFFGREDSVLGQQAAERLLETQHPTGGWSTHPVGEMEINASVKAYFALKLAGCCPSSEAMQRAREAIIAGGGADAVSPITRIQLATLGQVPYDRCPEIPPELLLLPKWFPVSLSALSAWSQAVAVPMSVISARRPVQALAAERGIRELFLTSPDTWPRICDSGRPFGLADRTFRFLRDRRCTPLRKSALRAAESRLNRVLEDPGGLGTTHMALMWSLIALHALGHDDESPTVQAGWKQLKALVVEADDGRSCRIQPSCAPVRDTTLALRALAAGGMTSDDRPLARGVDWLVEQQIDTTGAWDFDGHGEAGDSSDTALALMTLQDQFGEAPSADNVLPPKLRLLEEPDGEMDGDEQRTQLLERSTEAIDQGVCRLLTMQNSDGGWGAFDRDGDRKWLHRVAMAPAETLVDCSCPDLSGRALQALGQLGFATTHPAVVRCIDYLKQAQEPDGSWCGRWGVNYLHGTWQVLAGLAAVGVPDDDPLVAAAVNWLVAHQQPHGGWGETPMSYATLALRGQGPATATQTAWAVLGLLATGREDHPAVERGVRFLITQQQEDGTWDEPEFTSMGAPGSYPMRHEGDAISFALMALSYWARSASASQAGTAEAPRFGVVSEDGERYVASTAEAV